MAMSTYLQMVSAEELSALEREPAGINQLDQPVWARTHFQASLNYFLVGDAYPGAGAHALAPLLQGSRSVAAPTLENGSFYVLEASGVAAVLNALQAVDRDALRSAIESSDLESLVEDEELYDLELLAEEEVPNVIASELDDLLQFYLRVNEAGGAVVTYAT